MLVESFSGLQQETANVLNWKVSCFNSEPVFDIQRSSNGVNYSSLMDATGRQVFSQILTKGVQSITLPISQSGTYFYNIQNHAGKLITGKIIVL